MEEVDWKIVTEFWVRKRVESGGKIFNPRIRDLTSTLQRHLRQLERQLDDPDLSDTAFQALLDPQHLPSEFVYAMNEFQYVESRPGSLSSPREGADMFVGEVLLRPIRRRAGVAGRTNNSTPNPVQIGHEAVCMLRQAVSRAAPGLAPYTIYRYAGQGHDMASYWEETGQGAAVIDAALGVVAARDRGPLGSFKLGSTAATMFIAEIKFTGKPGATCAWSAGSTCGRYRTVREWLAVLDPDAWIFLVQLDRVHAVRPKVLLTGLADYALGLTRLRSRDVTCLADGINCIVGMHLSKFGEKYFQLFKEALGQQFLLNIVEKEGEEVLSEAGFHNACSRVPGLYCTILSCLSDVAQRFFMNTNIPWRVRVVVALANWKPDTPRLVTGRQCHTLSSGKQDPQMLGIFALEEAEDPQVTALRLPEDPRVFWDVEALPSGWDPAGRWVHLALHTWAHAPHCGTRAGFSHAKRSFAYSASGKAVQHVRRAGEGWYDVYVGMVFEGRGYGVDKEIASSAPFAVYFIPEPVARDIPPLFHINLETGTGAITSRDYCVSLKRLSDVLKTAAEYNIAHEKREAIYDAQLRGEQPRERCIEEFLSGGLDIRKLRQTTVQHAAMDLGRENVLTSELIAVSQLPLWWQHRAEAAASFEQPAVPIPGHRPKRQRREGPTRPPAPETELTQRLRETPPVVGPGLAPDLSTAPAAPLPRITLQKNPVLVVSAQPPAPPAPLPATVAPPRQWSDLELLSWRSFLPPAFTVFPAAKTPTQHHHSEAMPLWRPPVPPTPAARAPAVTATLPGLAAADSTAAANGKAAAPEEERCQSACAEL